MVVASVRQRGAGDAQAGDAMKRPHPPLSIQPRGENQMETMFFVLAMMLVLAVLILVTA